MIFSSISFLFFFLPLLFIIYFLMPRKSRNYVLLFFSLFFYFMGEKYYVFLLLFSCLVNYICGLLIQRKNSKIFLILGLLFNIGLLFYFKYTNFFISNLRSIFNININLLHIILPLGISFFTFQNISYLVDVYRKDVIPQKNFFLYATYITFFPQLVAGPIVRYKDLCDEMEKRKESLELFGSGVIRFVIGLGKKVLIADSLYELYSGLLSSSLSWLSYLVIAICFTLQIYYDFSGYSDMAIGLGKMFGFNFKENFNYPLISKSITDFWRRWHMSLSSFFKDYVYIPLGGNKVGAKRHILNIFIVWLLTGFWHGADWNFIIWGLYFFFFLILEKYFLKKYLKGGIFSHLYTLVVIIISFVIFSITDLSELLTFFKGLLGINVPLFNNESIFIVKNGLGVLLISLIGIFPWKEYFNKKKGVNKKGLMIIEIIFYMSILILSIAKIISSSFNPFIYFRF